MENEFYCSQGNFVPTATLSLLLALTALNANASNQAGMSQEPGPVLNRYANPYYISQEVAVMDDESQIEVIRRFAQNLLEKTEDTPQVIIDALNRQFWDLL
jgi:hypothetical protein